MINSNLLQSVQKYRTWVEKVYISNHYPIILQLDGFKQDGHFPLKLNSSWLLNEYFYSMVRGRWRNYELDTRVNPMDSLIEKLNHLKEVESKWIEEQKKKDKELLNKSVNNIKIVFLLEGRISF